MLFLLLYDDGDEGDGLGRTEAVLSFKLLKVVVRSELQVSIGANTSYSATESVYTIKHSNFIITNVLLLPYQ